MNSNKILTNNYNPQPIPVQVIYFIKNKIIASHKFFLNSTFGSILEYFEKLKEKGKTKLKNEYKHNNKKILTKEPLINLIELKKNSSSSTIESAEIYLELNEENNIINNNINNNPFFEIILQPKKNPFGIYVYKIKEGIISLEQYPEKINKKYELEKYDISSAYCNSRKYLYISGGKIKNKSLNDFWIINNKKFSINKKKMPYSKSNHSMIYIHLNNNEYIFIAGGDNNLITFYYNIRLKSFIIWSDMNTFNIKPALYQYNQYLYSFNCNFNIKNNDKLFFERTNLVTGKPYWEKIEPKYDVNITPNFQNKNICGICCGYNIDEVIILGGEERNVGDNEDGYSIIMYKFNKNILSEKQIINNINKGINSINLLDKKFYDINKTFCVNLPSSLDTKKEIVLINKIKQTIRKIPFNVMNNVISNIKIKEDNSEKNNDFNNNNDVGNIIVKAKIHERLRFEIKPEIVEAQKLTFEKKEDILDEKEIIKFEHIPEFSKNEIIMKNNNKKIKKKEKFYLANNVIYNNFVELLVDYNKSNSLQEEKVNKFI